MTATLKTVAAAAGVSIRTAGRALSGSGPVKAEVASRVLQAARELNYVPNAAARNLRRRSSRIVGVITGSGIRSEVIQRRLWLLENALREADRHTLLGALPGTPEELCSLLREWGGAGRPGGLSRMARELEPGDASPTAAACPLH